MVLSMGLGNSHMVTGMPACCDFSLAAPAFLAEMYNRDPDH